MTTAMTTRDAQKPVRKHKQHCRKKRYREYQQAVTALRGLQQISERETVPVRVYPCSRCHGYHLTSQPARVSDEETTGTE